MGTWWGWEDWSTEGVKRNGEGGGYHLTWSNSSLSGLALSLRLSSTAFLNSADWAAGMVADLIMKKFGCFGSGFVFLSLVKNWRWCCFGMDVLEAGKQAGSIESTERGALWHVVSGAVE